MVDPFFMLMLTQFLQSTLVFLLQNNKNTRNAFSAFFDLSHKTALELIE